MADQQVRLWRDIPYRERPWVVYEAVRKLQPLADVPALLDHIRDHHQRDVSGWLYVCLDRLEEQGYLRSEETRHPDPEEDRNRGHRNTRFYFPTGKPRPIAKSRAAFGGGGAFAGGLA